jgi:hypothetical protein
LEETERGGREKERLLVQWRYDPPPFPAFGGATQDVEEVEVGEDEEEEEEVDDDDVDVE